MNSKIKELQDKRAELLNDMVDILKSIGIDVDVDDIKDFADDVDRVVEELGNIDALNMGFVYHGDAMEYLAEHDPSLKESLDIAVNNYGYDVENLNACVLASVLVEQKIREGLSDAYRDIELIAEELQQINDKIDELENESK